MTAGGIIHIGPARLRIPATLGGAVERRMLELAVAQARAGLGPVTIFSIGERTFRANYEGVIIQYLKIPGVYLAGSFWFNIAFLRYLKRLRPRVIHVHNRAEIAWLLRRAAFPVVLSCDYHLEPYHGTPMLALITRVLWRRCLLAADVIAPVSEYCRETYNSYWLLRIPAGHVLSNGVDDRRFSPDADLRSRKRSEWQLEDKIVWLYVGRVCEQKGTDLVLDAFRRIRGTHPDVALVIVGPAGIFGQLTGSPLIAALQEAGAMYFPPVHDSDLPAVYNSADIFVMPTRDLEMFGMAAVEAEACGVPVVASDHGGLRETVPESAGRRFSTGDAHDLSRVLSGLGEDRPARERLAAGARANASRYAWEKIVTKAESLYREARTRRSGAE